MTDQSSSQEQRILRVMRKVLASVIKDTTPDPGMRHPLSDATIRDIRECLALIAAREAELATAQGLTPQRPYYTDEPGTASVVSIAGIKGKGKPTDKGE